MNAANVKGMFFLDTNVFVYTFDREDQDKQRVAREWVRQALLTQRGMTGAQVVQEFMNVALKKFESPMGVTEAREYLNGVMRPLCQHFPTMPSFDRALLIREETGYAWYDSLIVTAAVEAKCSWLISEDLQHGRKIGSVTVHNPFR
jgi:predicted nucleic acid-binding protein